MASFSIKEFTSRTGNSHSVESLCGSDNKIELIEITNDAGLRARLLTWGATLVSVWFTDKHGKEQDLVLGYDTIEEYQTDQVQMGKTIGRVSNRIKNGEFNVNDERISVEKNEGNNHLHGGSHGCSQRNWAIHARAPHSVTFKIIQTHEIDGYPGEATMKCTYTVNESSQLVVEHWAETTVPCPIAMTNHAYWNLDNDSTTCLDHCLYVLAHNYLPLDDEKCPNGDQKPVFGTSYNFNKMRRIGPSPPIDHDLILTDHGKDQIVLALENPKTGIRMTVRTSYPSIHIYSAEKFDGTLKGKGGCSYVESAGLAIEPQQFTSAVHFDWFPPVIVDPATPYEQEIVYQFQHIQRGPTQTGESRQYNAVIFDYGGVLMSFCKEVPAWTELERDNKMEAGSIHKHLFGILDEQPALAKDIFEGRTSADELEEEILPRYLETKIGVVLPRPFPVLNKWMGPGSKIPFNENMMRVVRNLNSRGMHTSILTNNYKMDTQGVKVRTPVDTNLFDVIVESSIEGKMKPDREIYEITQSRIPSSISPHECIFLDDNKLNIKAAEDFGWTSILVDPHNIDESIRKLEGLLNMDLSD